MRDSKRPSQELSGTSASEMQTYNSSASEMQTHKSSASEMQTHKSSASEMQTYNSSASEMRTYDRMSVPAYLGTLSGLTLFVADYPIHFWVLHFVALVPLFVALLRTAPNRRGAFLIAWSFALSYAVPLLLSAGNKPPVVVAALTGLLMWLVMIPCMHRLIHRGPIIGPLACAGAACLFELALWHLVPVFGTAQCFARVTGEAPWLIQFAAYTGLVGVVFILVWSQAMLGQIATLNRQRAPVLILAFLVPILGIINWQRWVRPLTQQQSVAAISWGANAKLSLKDLCNEAISHNARIMVTPETGFVCPEDTAEQSVQGIVQDVQTSELFAAVGIFRRDIRKNQILFIEPSAGLVAKYEKSHLIPLLETYNSGDGTLVPCQWLDSRCGGMICQDDNFTDLARGYGRLGTQLLLVPTNDWAPIRLCHRESRNGGLFCAHFTAR
jgi:apolipoprotein N-acyltransferase